MTPAQIRRAPTTLKELHRIPMKKLVFFDEFLSFLLETLPDLRVVVVAVDIWGAVQYCWNVNVFAVVELGLKYHASVSRKLNQQKIIFLSPVRHICFPVASSHFRKRFTWGKLANWEMSVYHSACYTAIHVLHTQHLKQWWCSNTTWMMDEMNDCGPWTVRTSPWGLRFLFSSGVQYFVLSVFFYSCKLLKPQDLLCRLYTPYCTLTRRFSRVLSKIQDNLSHTPKNLLS